MHNQGALAYQRTAQQTAGPRDLEANLLARLATRLQQIRDNWPDSRPELIETLNKNRKVWSIFVQSVTKDDHPLPAPVRQNVANLGVFVLGQTFELLNGAEPHKLDALININRQISAGLRGNGG